MEEKHFIKIVVFISVIAIISFIIAVRDKNRLTVIKSDFKDPVFLIIFAFIIIISIIGLSLKNTKINNSTTNAIIAFIIAFFAHLNMPFVAFFVVGLFIYYNDDDHYVQSYTEKEDIVKNKNKPNIKLIF